MKKGQYDEIIEYLKNWVRREGLCRFCTSGRSCKLSRRGRHTCPHYWFANEMDCFHLWIARFDKGIHFRKGYDTPNSYPWMNQPRWADIPSLRIFRFPNRSYKEKSRLAKLRLWKNRKHHIMQMLDYYSKKLKKVLAEIRKLEKTT